VTPAAGSVITEPRRWFADVAQTEIIPLLEEYWFDAPDKVKAAAQRLVDGL
jgi:5-methylcytosine-specific restriction enzyme B